MGLVSVMHQTHFRTCFRFPHQAGSSPPHTTNETHNSAVTIRQVAEGLTPLVGMRPHHLWTMPGVYSSNATSRMKSAPISRVQHVGQEPERVDG